MATPSQSQVSFKAAMAKMDAIKAGAEARGKWEEADHTAFNTALADAKSIKAVVEREAEVENLKSWASGSDPAQPSAVKAGWAGESLPGDGEQPEITEQRDSQGQLTGELYATGPLGAAKLKALKSGDYKSAFAAHIRNQCNPSRFPMKASYMKVLNEGVDNQGLYWVPPDIRPDLVKKMATITSIRQNAYAFTTGSELVKFPRVVYTTDDLYTSGMRPTWTSEPLLSDASEATNPVAGQFEIPIYTMIIPILVTRSQLEDNGFDLLGYLTKIMGETTVLFENAAFVTGDGAGKPWGVLSHSNATVAASSGGMRVASGSASTYIWGTDMVKGLTAAEAALPPQYESNAKWFGTKKAYGLIRGIVDGQARPLWNVNDQYPTFTNGYAQTLLGYPIVKDQFFQEPTTLNNIGLVFGDMQGYYIADRVGLSVEVLREVKALRDQYVIYARKRVGAQLIEDWRLKTIQTAAS